MRIGLRSVDDVLINLGAYKKINPNYGDKKFVLNAIYKHDYKTLREISNYFYESSGIYYRLCKYLAFLYRFDWYVTPYVVDVNKEKEDNSRVGATVVQNTGLSKTAELKGKRGRGEFISTGNQQEYRTKL